MLASKEYLESKFKEMISETVLHEILNELKVKKELYQISKEKEAMNARVTGLEATIYERRNKVQDLEVKADTLEPENENLKKSISYWKKNLMPYQIEFSEVSEIMNNNREQYTRRNSIWIYDIEDSASETDQETCKTFQKLLNDKLKRKLSSCDFDIAHRIGEFRRGGNRVMICKFVQRIMKVKPI